MYDWLGISIIIIGSVLAAYIYKTRATAKCVDPNMDDLIKKVNSLSKEDFELIKSKVDELC